MVAAHTVSNALKSAEASIPEHKSLLEIAKAVAAEMVLVIRSV